MRLVWLGLVVAVACGKGGDGRVLPGGGGSGTAQVTYQPGARVLERDEGLHAIVGTSTDGWTLVFDTSVPKLQGLKAGDIVIIKGLIARKVLAVQPMANNEVAALTQGATLGEALQKGEVQLQAGIRFKKKHASLWQRATNLVEGTAYADVPDIDIGPKALTVKGKYEGWDATGSASLDDGKVNLDIELAKSLGGFKALITAKGWLQDFDVTSHMHADAGALDRLELMAKNLNGRMDISWEVGKESPGVETGKASIKLPAMVEIPLYEFLDGFPLFLDVSGALLIEPALTSGKQISKGAVHFTYNGTDGVKFEKGDVDGAGAKMDGDADFDSAEAVSAAGPVGMVVAFAAPRLELTFGIAKVFKGMGEIKEAAEKVDTIADDLIKNLLGADALAKWKASPMGGFSIGKAAEAALSSDASAWLELEMSTGMTQSGALSVVPCRQRQLHIAATAGVGAQILGTSVANKSTTIWKVDRSKTEPSNLKACQ
jgi:hypothetical protein